jgi:hypothetical protein
MRRNSVEVTEEDIETLDQYMKGLARRNLDRDIVGVQVLKARNLYVTKLKSREQVAKEIGVSITVIDNWISRLGWESLRTKKQLETLSVNTKLIGADNIDNRHDRLFDKMELMITDILTKARDGQEKLSVSDISNISKAAKICMEARRAIRGKGGKVEKKIIELQGTGLFDSFKKMLIGLVEPVELKQLSTSDPRVEVEVHEVEKDRSKPLDSCDDSEFENENEE